MLKLPGEILLDIRDMLEPHNQLMWLISCRCFRSVTSARVAGAQDILVSAIKCRDVHLVRYLLRVWPAPRYGMRTFTKSIVERAVAKFSDYCMLMALASFPLEPKELVEYSLKYKNYDVFTYSMERCYVKEISREDILGLMEHYDLRLIEYLFLHQPVYLYASDCLFVCDVDVLERLLRRIRIRAEDARRLVYEYLCWTDHLKEPICYTIRKLELLHQKFGISIFEEIDKISLFAIEDKKPEIAKWLKSQPWWQ